MTRQDVVRAARAWIGTPYRHQASQCGVGADCLGVVRGVWRDLYGREPEPVPPYAPDWTDALKQEDLLDAAQRHFIEVALSAARPGDLLLFRMGLGHPAKHCGILSAPDRLIHAYWGRAVCETRLVPWWRRRRAGAFQFPALTGNAHTPSTVL